MKRLIQISSLAATLLATSYITMVKATKITTFDMREVFQKLPQRQTVVKRIKDEFSPRVRELEKLQGKIQDLYQKRKKDRGLLSHEELTKINRQLESLQSEFQLKRKNFDDDHHQASQREQKKLVAKIQAAVSKIAKRKGYDLVLPIDTTAYAKSSLDISKQVINEVSKSN